LACGLGGPCYCATALLLYSLPARAMLPRPLVGAGRVPANSWRDAGGTACCHHCKRMIRPWGLCCVSPIPRIIHRPPLCFLHLNPIVPARCASVEQRALSLQSWMCIEVPIQANAAMRSPQIQCVLVIRESFTKEYGSRVSHSSPCGPLCLHIEPNQLSLIRRTHCNASLEKGGLMR